MDAAAFVDKWRKSRRSERSASHEHFLDLCEVLKHPKPGAVDPKGLTFTTERRVKKEGGKHGFADAWKKGFFGWEYKKKGADLNAAYNWSFAFFPSTRHTGPQIALLAIKIPGAT